MRNMPWFFLRLCSFLSRHCQCAQRHPRETVITANNPTAVPPQLVGFERRLARLLLPLHFHPPMAMCLFPSQSRHSVSPPPSLIESLILKGAEAEWLTTLYQVPASALLWGWWKGARSISQPLQKRCASRYKSLRGSAIHFLIGGVNCRNVALWLLQSRPPVLVLRFSLGARVISADSLGKTDTGLSENPWTRGARFCASHRENTRLSNY